MQPSNLTYTPSPPPPKRKRILPYPKKHLNPAKFTPCSVPQRFLTAPFHTAHNTYPPTETHAPVHCIQYLQIRLTRTHCITPFPCKTTRPRSNRLAGRPAPRRRPPLQSGLFYIAPGTLLGGRYADHIVKKYIRIRGKRVPEDRLRSCVVFLGGIIPACMIVYGWSVEKKVGGIALPVIMMFLQGVAQLFCFPSLNTYCLDGMQGRSAEVISGNYFMRYMFGAAGSAVCLPCIRAIGVGWCVGWFSTISAMFLVAGATGTYVTACYGKQWRVAIDDKKAAKKEGEGQV